MVFQSDLWVEKDGSRFLFLVYIYKKLKFTSTAIIIIAAFFLIVEFEGRFARECTPIPRLFIGGRSNQSGSLIPPMQSLAMG